MWKKLISLLEKIKCKFMCCYESQCSMNDKNKLNDIDIEDEEEFVDEHSGF